KPNHGIEQVHLEYFEQGNGRVEALVNFFLNLLWT
ncbi:MAG: hypothetical protein RLZZ572_522, partial [Pseudomonadota bacterium]